MSKMDFISFSTDVIRAQIKGIDDSYRNPWDILAELAQNSIDAIGKTDRAGRIDIEINSGDHSIRFRDNGCGIAAEKLPVLLNLFSSDKRNDASTIGEKGVGLKFVLFQSSYFEIRTCDGETSASAIVKDANTWKVQSGEDMIKMDFHKGPATENSEPGTEIYVKGVQPSREDADEESISFFKMSVQEILFLLRTKTAIGNTSLIWDGEIEDIDINLKYIDFNNVSHDTKVKYGYWLPVESLDDKQLVNIEDFEEWMRKSDRSDSDKRRKLQGKILYLKGTYYHNNHRKISYWTCMLPTRGVWDDLNIHFDLATKTEIEDEDWVDLHQSVLFKEGIYIATKGMPTGISTETPRTGNSGYWSNCFMLFQDDALKFDIGRKSIHGRISGIYKEKAKELFNRIVKLMVKYTSARPAVIDDMEFDQYEIRKKIESIVDLGVSSVRFEKSPAEQEASVSAIFFELVGAGRINDIIPIYLGYRHKYDMYAYFVQSDGDEKWGIYEFKSHLKNVIRDFSDARKMFDEMNYIICWDVTDGDIQEMSNAGIECETYSPGCFGNATVPSCVTHILSIPNVKPIYVIDLKDFVKTIA